MLTGVARSASTDPTAAAMMRDLLTEGPLLAIATTIDVPDAPLRAALAGTQLIGLVMARYVVGVEPVASMDAAALAAAMGPTIERYLFGEPGRGAGRARWVGLAPCPTTTPTRPPPSPATPTPSPRACASCTRRRPPARRTSGSSTRRAAST